ncbi:conserved exported hypothetical protein [uncultured Eubacteriales bacterium]|uniref:Lipoprotein n=1 Tax=uncultured Eubacteriales bacterium TaxID=172733 RepID=A0A212KIS4_9FIRM|nr:conserved exported hypothetical protein [uncultured Eubacteriales bacterium]
MKVARFVLKIIAVSLGAAAAACCIIAYWDKIAGFFGNVHGKLAEKRAGCCRRSEYDDYADWDEG